MVVQGDIDQLPAAQINYPEGCLTPTTISKTSDGKGTILEWKLDKALTTAGMGVALPKPEQPGAKVSLVLKNNPYTLMLLVVTICLTFLILGEKINFLEISLLSAVYYILFITMASVSDHFIGFFGSLALGSAMTLYLSHLLYRNYPKELIRKNIYYLVVFFAIIYPISGLFPSIEDSFKGVVNVCLIIYLFFISLHSRINGE
ncbi:hypothetical protein HZC34_00765 [Candidatus Saganbacteria bacterium]|nr:hypothetical protein [Candidatus Saganbacteria bacterium]